MDYSILLHSSVVESKNRRSMFDQIKTSHGATIVFDAECLLCSANAWFILKHDHNEHFFLASMQSPVGQDLLSKNGVDPKDPSTIIIVENSKTIKDSTAVLAIYWGLGWPWRALGVLQYVPLLLRDGVYWWVAKNRYRIFGKRSTCWIAPPRYKSRILENNQ